MSEYILIRISAIQKELEDLKQAIARELQGTRRPTKLEGLWDGIEITDEDLEAAEKAVFRDAYKWQD
jgi:hypothetical protein